MKNKKKIIEEKGKNEKSKPKKNIPQKSTRIKIFE